MKRTLSDHQQRVLDDIMRRYDLDTDYVSRTPGDSLTGQDAADLCLIIREMERGVDWRALLQALIDDVNVWEDDYDYDAICKSCYRVVLTWKKGEQITHPHADTCAYIAAKEALEKHPATE